MASNPMQRKARNSFLLGMLLTMLIAAVVIVLLFMQIKDKDEEVKKLNSEKQMVWVLKQDIKSGQTITADMCEQRSVTKTAVPNPGSMGDAKMIEALSLKDKEGNTVTSSMENGVVHLYLNKGEDGEKIELTETAVTESTGATTYTYTYEENGRQQSVDFTTMPLIAKIDLKANTVLTNSMVTQGEDTTTDDMRVQDYNMISLPPDLQEEDQIDIRLSLPNGQDYVVISKKPVKIPTDDAGTPLDANTIRLSLTEMETLYLGNAIIDHYRISGSKLYATKYTEAGLQKAAGTTYTPNSNIVALIRANPNIVEEVKQGLGLDSNGNPAELRSTIDAVANADVAGEENVKSKVEESITSSQEARQAYLGTVGGTAAAAQ